MSRPQWRPGCTRAVSPERYDSERSVEGRVEEVYCSKSKPRRNTLMGDRHKSNRCTYFRPSITDFSQLTEFEKPTDNYRNILLEQFGLETTVPDRGESMHELNVPSIAIAVEHGSPCAPVSKSMIHADQSDYREARWQVTDSTIEDQYARSIRDAGVQSAISDQPIETRVRIGEVPRIRVIAEKFSKFKKNNIELRKLEEKVVCLEYDVFNKDADDAKPPIQKMRAFFMIKARKNKDNANETIILPPKVKENFNLEDGDFERLQKKEIEMIDCEIPENRSLLEDLKKVLRRKQAIEHKKKQNTLDLEYLYHVAKRECSPLDEVYSRTYILSKEELDEIRDLILKKCASSVHGIRRKMVKSELGDSVGSACISNCLAAELMREDKDII